MLLKYRLQRRPDGLCSVDETTEYDWTCALLLCQVCDPAGQLEHLGILVEAVDQSFRLGNQGAQFGDFLGIEGGGGLEISVGEVALITVK
ncbi:hypothetical protein D9M68_916750 [compost metagenome]